MARQLRIECEGAFYYVITRGIRGSGLYQERFSGHYEVFEGREYVSFITGC